MPADLTWRFRVDRTPTRLVLMIQKPGEEWRPAVGASETMHPKTQYAWDFYKGLIDWPDD